MKRSSNYSPKKNCHIIHKILSKTMFQTNEQMQFFCALSAKKFTNSSPQIASPFFAIARNPRSFLHLQT